MQRAGATGTLEKIHRGIEREALRIRPSGELALTPHPEDLGAPLTHPAITTDFSESQLEFITAVHTSVPELLDDLSQSHAFAWHCMGEEMLWPLSMPCSLPNADEIPLGHYGSSHQGRFKELYRLGLKHRYGASMQTISGVHYNFSLPAQFWPLWQRALGETGPLQQSIDGAYLALARNFLRYHWVLLYLLGESPMAPGDLADDGHQLDPWPHGGGRYGPLSTSLRNGHIGYSAASQPGVELDYNSLDSYCTSLMRAIEIPVPAWQKLTDEHEEPVQLGTGQLQIENELYAPVRLKCIEPGLRPVTALMQHGIRHLEIRCVDLDGQSPTGVSASGCHLLDMFLLWCLCTPSAPLQARDNSNFLHNNEVTVIAGRNPDTEVRIGADKLGLQDALTGVLAEMQQLADLWGADLPQSADWQQTLEQARLAATNPDRTPSGRQLQRLTQQQQSFCTHGLELARLHREHWLAHPLAPQVQAQMRRTAAESVRERQQLEAKSTGEDFDHWLANRLSLPTH